MISALNVYRNVLDTHFGVIVTQSGLISFMISALNVHRTVLDTHFRVIVTHTCTRSGCPSGSPSPVYTYLM